MPNAISFLAGSMVDANVTGDWRPVADAADGTSPADYGARVSYLGGFAVVNFAGRNLVAGLVGPATTINGSGEFDLATTSVEFLERRLSISRSCRNRVGHEYACQSNRAIERNRIARFSHAIGADDRDAYVSGKRYIQFQPRRIDARQPYINGPASSNLDLLSRIAR